MGNKQQTVAVVETHSGGHHVSYFEAICRALLTGGYSVSAFCTTAVSQIIHQREPSFLNDRAFKLREFTQPSYKNLRNVKLSWAIYNFRGFLTLERLLRQAEKADKQIYRKVVTSTMYDSSLYGFAWTRAFFKRKVYGIYMNSSFFREGIESYLKWSISDNPSFLRDTRIRGPLVFDPGIVESINKWKGEPISDVICDFADPLPKVELSEFRAAKRKANGRPIVALVGFLNQMKNVSMFVKVSQCLPEIYFYLHGEVFAEHYCEEEIQDWNDLSQDKDSNFTFIRDRIPEDGAFHFVFQNADVMFLAYQSFPNSSNQLSLAKVYGAKAIIPRTGCMADLSKSDPKLIKVDPTSEQSVKQGVQSAIASPQKRVMDPEQIRKLSSRSFREQFLRYIGSD